MWFKARQKNRRAGRPRVLDVKLRSGRVLAARTRLLGLALGFSVCAMAACYALWRAGDWALDRLVYKNKSFTIQQVDIQTDGSLAVEQLRRWCAIQPGENLLALDLARVKHDLEMVPMIQSVSIERILPGTLRIRVIEREPVAQVNILRPRTGGGVELGVLQVDAEGYVIQPLETPPNRTTTEAGLADEPLPAISGLNISELRPGRRVESAQAQAALRLIVAFDHSPMSGLVDLKRVDISTPQVLVATTEQGSEVTFGLDNFERQLLHWQLIHEECNRWNKAIATLDLAVSENTPLRLQDAGSLPPPPKNVKPQRTRKRNV